MESIRSKRRGFMKSKLVMPFHKAPKPTTNTTTTSSTTSTLTSSTATTTNKVVMINPEPMMKSKKVSFVSTVPCDEAVDLKAANYISCVQERFRLQRLSSERRVANMVPQDAQ